MISIKRFYFINNIICASTSRATQGKAEFAEIAADLQYFALGPILVAQLMACAM